MTMTCTNGQLVFSVAASILCDGEILTDEVNSAVNHSLDDVFAKNQNSRERETSGRTTYILTLQVSYM